MSKNDNIWKLYDSLNKSGSRGEVLRAIAADCKRNVNTVRNHWFHNREVPEEFQDKVISILQKAVKKQNDSIKSIETQSETVTPN